MYIFFIVILIAVAYYCALLLVSKRIADRINFKRTDLETKAVYDNAAKKKWEKSIEKRKNVAKVSFVIITVSQYFILAMLFIGSYFELEKILLLYKKTGRFLLFQNLKSMLIPIITVWYSIFVVKWLFQSKEKDQI